MSSTSISASDLRSLGVGQLTGTAVAAAAPAAPGGGDLRIARQGTRSVVERACATSPLRLLTPRNDGHAAWIFTSSFGGGLVDGDRLSLRLEIKDEAAALLSTQASTKVYRSRMGTSASLDATIGRGGLLVSLPDPVVCFADSRFDQRQTFALAEGASLVAVDWFTSGRRESGERCAFERYYSRIDVRVEQRLVVMDALAVSRDVVPVGAAVPVGRASRSRSGIVDQMGRFDVMAVAVIIGDAVVRPALDLVIQLREQRVVRQPGQVVVASPVDRRGVGDIGCVLRVAGPSVEEVGQTLRRCLAFVPGLLGDDPWMRKW